MGIIGINECKTQCSVCRVIHQRSKIERVKDRHWKGREGITSEVSPVSLGYRHWGVPEPSMKPPS